MKAASAPAAPEAVEAAETSIGFRLPPPVRRLYLEVADGGVGPFGGFAPLQSLVDWHGAYALLDCRYPEARTWWCTEGERHKLSLTFPEWLNAWLSGDLTHRYMQDREFADEESWAYPPDDEP